MRDILIKNACIITGTGRAFPSGFVRVSDGKISALGNDAAWPRGSNALLIDAGGRYVLPGFINPHMHFYGVLSRGMGVGRMKTFGEVLKNLWWKLDRALTLEDVHISALVCGIEAIKSGVTTVFDHHASYGAVMGSLGTVAKAVSGLGIRASLCYEISDRNGKRARDMAASESALWLDFVASRSGGTEHFPLRGMVGLHASMTLSDATLDIARELMETYDVGAHVHVAEGVEDLKITKKMCGLTPAARLAKKGILKDGSIAAHCVHVSTADMNILKRCGVSVVHNPLSNLNNAVGVAPILSMARRGIPVMIGTDGMSAGISDDVRLAACLHNPTALDAQASGLMARSAVWENAPAFASKVFGVELGVIRKGAAADIIIVDAVPPTDVTGENAWWHVLFGTMNSPVRTVVALGRVIMRDFNIANVDEKAIAREAKRLAKRLWKNI